MKHTNQHNKSSASIRVYLRQKTKIGMTMASASGALYAAFMAFRRKEEDSTEGDLVNHETHENHEREGELDVDNVDEGDDVGLEDDFVDGLEGTFEDEEMSDEDFGSEDADGKTQSADGGGVPSSSNPPTDSDKTSTEDRSSASVIANSFSTGDQNTVQSRDAGVGNPYPENAINTELTVQPLLRNALNIFIIEGRKEARYYVEKLSGVSQSEVSKRLEEIIAEWDNNKKIEEKTREKINDKWKQDVIDTTSQEEKDFVKKIKMEYQASQNKNTNSGISATNGVEIVSNLPATYLKYEGLKKLVQNELYQVGGEIKMIADIQDEIKYNDNVLTKKFTDEVRKHFVNKDPKAIAKRMCFMNSYFTVANNARVRAGLSPISFKDAYINMLKTGSVDYNGFCSRQSNDYLNIFGKITKLDSDHDTGKKSVKDFMERYKYDQNNNPRVFHLRRAKGEHSINAIWDETTNNFLIADPAWTKFNGKTLMPMKKQKVK